MVCDERNEHVPPITNQPDGDKNTNQEEEENVIKKKMKKTSSVWKDFDEVEIVGAGKKAICKYCKVRLYTGGPGGSTSHVRRHSEKCNERRLQMAKEKNQSVIPIKPSNPSNPFLIPGVKYSNERMREIIATVVMVHEYPFSIVEDEVWMWAFQYGNHDFQKVSRKTMRNDCVAIYNAEKNRLKAFLKTVNKISLRTDMWKSSHQVVEYIVVTGHFIDIEWKLQKRVLSFVKVSTPRRGIDVADSIFKCLKMWGLKKRCFDNASYNDKCLKNLKENLSLNTKLVLNGDLFHVRCCARILNLLVRDGLGKIKDIIQNVRESVKYINHNDARLKVFSDIVEQKHLKERKC